MFDNLIESRAKKQRRAGGVIFSAVLHVVLITAAVYGTLQAKNAIDKPKSEKVEFVEMKKKDEPPPPKEEPKPPPPDVVMKAPPPKGFQVLTAPIKIPDVLPDIDLSKKVTNEEDFSGRGQGGDRRPELRAACFQIPRRDIPTYSAPPKSKAKWSPSSSSTQRAAPT